MLERHKFIRLICVAFCLASASTTAWAQQSPLRSGSYRCFTTDSAPPTTAQEPRDRDQRRSQGLRDIEPGERYVPPMQAPGTMIVPAFFGNITVDGKGNYRLTRSGHVGKYGFNAAAGVPTFTGDLSIMKINGYDARAGRFFLVYDSLAYQCGLDTQSQVAPASAAVKSTRKATAADFTGRFVGTYICYGRSTPMQLDAQATAAGQIVAVYNFQGKGDIIAGRFSLVGTWTAAGFTLQPNEWLVRPAETYQMVGLDGFLSTKGIAGRAVHPQCTTFELIRE